MARARERFLLRMGRLERGHDHDHLRGRGRDANNADQRKPRWRAADRVCLDNRRRQRHGKRHPDGVHVRRRHHLDKPGQLFRQRDKLQRAGGQVPGGRDQVARPGKGQLRGLGRVEAGHDHDHLRTRGRDAHHADKRVPRRRGGHQFRMDHCPGLRQRHRHNDGGQQRRRDQLAIADQQRQDDHELRLDRRAVPGRENALARPGKGRVLRLGRVETGADHDHLRRRVASRGGQQPHKRRV